MRESGITDSEWLISESTQRCHRNSADRLDNMTIEEDLLEPATSQPLVTMRRLKGFEAWREETLRKIAVDCSFVMFQQLNED